MSTATLTEENTAIVDEEENVESPVYVETDIGNEPLTQDECVNFRMPDVPIGTSVLYYPHGQDVGKPPLVATVIRVFRSGRLLAVRIASSGRVAENVRHIDDPKLRINSDMREDGAWDFTQEFSEIREEIRKLTSRVQALELRAGTSAGKTNLGAKPEGKPTEPGKPEKPVGKKL